MQVVMEEALQRQGLVQAVERRTLGWTLDAGTVPPLVLHATEAQQWVNVAEAQLQLAIDAAALISEPLEH